MICVPIQYSLTHDVSPSHMGLAFYDSFCIVNTFDLVEKEKGKARKKISFFSQHRKRLTPNLPCLLYSETIVGKDGKRSIFLSFACEFEVFPTDTKWARRVIKKGHKWSGPFPLYIFWRLGSYESYNPKYTEAWTGPGWLLKTGCFKESSFHLSSMWHLGW